MTSGPSEDETCRDVVLPALAAAGWRPEQISPQHPLRASRTVSLGGVSRELGAGKVDYVLEVVPGLPVAVVEAKRAYKKPDEGLQQAIRYAQQLDVPTAIATNGAGLVERDLGTGRERAGAGYPTPVEAWARYVEHHHLSDRTQEALRQPFDRTRRTAAQDVITPRWYQAVAVHRMLRAVLAGERRLLLLMATGTGKTFTAMQLVAKLRAYCSATDPTGNHRVLYLADRDALLEQPMRKDFVPAFGPDAVARVRGGARMGRDVYFATYQALSGSAGDAETLFREYPPDFFDLVVVDECHRGSASERSSWRQVLHHFAPAVQLGLTATPLQAADVDTYAYFGDPLFEYSLREGIEDGFLAPYRVRRVVLSPDAEGWRPAPGEVDRFGTDIPDGVYGTAEFERVVSLLARTRLMARHLSRLLRPDPSARAIVFCQDVEHAEQVRAALVEENPDLLRADPEWVVRIVGVENEKARLLEAFTDPESGSPVVATTSRLLSTGVDVEDLRFVVLFRPVGSMVEFKQIIGRGTRLYPDKGKASFEIVDYVGATAKFADPDFDGPPLRVAEEVVDDDGEVVSGAVVGDAADASLAEEPPPYEAGGSGDAAVGPASVPGADAGGGAARSRKLYVDDGEPRVVGESYSVPRSVDGRLQLLEYGEYVGDQVRRLFPSPEGLLRQWSAGPSRREVHELLDAHGVDVGRLMDVAQMPGADPVDVLRHLAWDLPVPTRAARASRARREHLAELALLSQEARTVLTALLDRYAEHGVEEVLAREVLTMPPMSELGSPVDIAAHFGSSATLHERIDELQRWIYSSPA